MVNIQKLNQLENLGFTLNPKKEYQKWGRGFISEITILNYGGFRVEIHSGEYEELTNNYYLYESNELLDEDGDFERFIKNVKEELNPTKVKKPSFMNSSIDGVEYCVEIRYSNDKDISTILVNDKLIWNTSYPSKDDRFHFMYCMDYIFPLWLEGKLDRTKSDEDYRSEFNKSVKHSGVQLKGTKEEFYKNIK
jgi:hypothetical protein